MHCNETSDFIEIYATEYTEDRIYWMQNSLQSSGKIEDQYILAKKDMNKRQRLNVFYDIAECKMRRELNEELNTQISVTCIENMF